MKKLLKKLGIKIWFDKVGLVVGVEDVGFMTLFKMCIDNKSLGSYLLLPFVMILMGFSFCFLIPFFLLANIKFGERE